jgi:glycosyltransferase involved in cell wall biosynthesis
LKPLSILYACLLDLNEQESPSFNTIGRVKGLAALGHRVVLFCLSAPPMDSGGSIRLVEIDRGQNLRSGVAIRRAMQAAVNEELANHRHDLVLSRSLEPCILSPALRESLPTAVEVHGCLLDDAEDNHVSWIRRRVMSWRERAGTEAAVLVLPASVRIESYLQDRYGWLKGRMKVRRNGVETGFFRPPSEQEADAAKTEFPFARGHPTVCFVGSHSGLYDLGPVVQGMARVPDLQLAIAGDRALSDGVAALAASAGVADRVHCVGKLSRERVRSLLWACDAGLNPIVGKRPASISTKVGEYLAAGCWVITRTCADFDRERWALALMEIQSESAEEYAGQFEVLRTRVETGRWLRTLLQDADRQRLDWSESARQVSEDLELLVATGGR